MSWRSVKRTMLPVGSMRGVAAAPAAPSLIRLGRNPSVASARYVSVQALQSHRGNLTYQPFGSNLSDRTDFTPLITVIRHYFTEHSHQINLHIFGSVCGASFFCHSSVRGTTLINNGS